MIIEFLEKKEISDDITSYDFYIKNIESAEQIATLIPRFLEDQLNQKFGTNELYACLIEATPGENSRFKYVVINIQIKQERVPVEFLERMLEKAINQFS